MKHHPRLDGNQAEIVSGLRSIGASVQSLASIGSGAPDILVGFRGVNKLYEIKDPSKPPSKRLLTDDEMNWHLAWRGQIKVVETLDEILADIGFTYQGKF